MAVHARATAHERGGRGAQTVTAAEEFAQGRDRAALQLEVRELRERLVVAEQQLNALIDGHAGSARDVARMDGVGAKHFNRLRYRARFSRHLSSKCEMARCW